MFNMKIVAIGDSITEGYPYGVVKSWVYVTAQKLHLNIINRGIAGDLTGDILARFQRDAVNLKPSHVIILGGTNDAYAGYSVDQVALNISKMVEICLKESIIPYLGIPIPSNSSTEEKLLWGYRVWIKKFAEINGVKQIDFCSAFHDQDCRINRSLYLDDVHPNENGYLVMSSVAKDFLRRIINNG